MPRTLEIEDTSVDAAVDRALEELSTTRDAVQVEVLDEGRAGFLGVGERRVRVRVTLNDAMPDDGAEDAPKPDGDTPPTRARRARRSLTGRDGAVNRPRGPRRVKKKKTVTQDEPSVEVQRESARDVAPAERAAPAPQPDAPRKERAPAAAEPDAPQKERAPAAAERDDSRRERTRDEEPDRPRDRPRRGREGAREASRPRRRRPAAASVDAFTLDPSEVVIKLLDLIGCEGEVHAQGGGEAYEVDVEADDTSLLIGRHGQNLESLQYLVNRICNRGVSEPTPIMIDVAGYRQRRLETLEGLADSLADKVARTDRPISMEPLPPHERRIIHLYLRDDEDVETFSRGDGDERYLVIASRRSRR